MAHPAIRSAVELSTRMTNACRQLEHAIAELNDNDAPTPEDMHAAVDGAINATVALAELVNAIRAKAPAALRSEPDPFLVRELQADLHAMHGCLTTAPLLLAPSREDLANLLSEHDGPVRAVPPQRAGRS